jgi:hypothetical protein
MRRKMAESILKHTGLFNSRSLCFFAILVSFTFFNPFSSSLYAQLVITSPLKNQVLQQDNNGFANIAITGYAHFPYTRIQAFLIPDPTNPHSPKEYSFTDDQIRQGFLSAFLQAETGWYQLKIIGYGDHGIIDSALVDRVGVGEVFLAAGNSNAMGLPDLGAKDASDQVVSFNAINKVLNSENITIAPDGPMPMPTYTPIKAKSYIFPSGETSWYWGELGDMLSKKMNTPVLFLNAAWAAANSENYRDGAIGKDAFNIYVKKYWPNRQPYTNIVNTLRYFNAELGLRTILWSHGENDAQLNYSEEDYFNNIKTLIENSRRDSGYPASWVIARNSASFSIPTPSVPIINAQNRLTAIKGFKTFPGPVMDTIQIPRPSNGHFQNIQSGVQGLTQAATAWNRILSDSLFNEITPIQPGFAIHTGLVPSKVFPGAAFTLPYTITGLADNTTAIQAELLDESGKFVSLAGTENKNLLTIKLPDNLANGRYRLRLTASNPVLTGSVSRLFLVNKSYGKVDFVNSVAAKRIEENTYISWHVAANSQIKRMVIQKTTDGEIYSDMESFNAIDNEKQSRLYTYQDQNTGNESTYYRIKMEDVNGQVSYSTVLAVFKEGTPPNFVVFPNPVTNQQFYLKPDAAETNIRCSLFDMRGSEHPILTSDSEIIGLISVRPVYPLPVGNYVLRVTTDAGVNTQMVLFN